MGNQKKLGKNGDVILEYPGSDKKERAIYYDIYVVVKDNDKNIEESHLIELKYRTKKDTIRRHGHDFQLKNQGAQNLGRLHFIKDIARLESQDVVNGSCYCIMLTNDKSYMAGAKSEKIKDKDFRLKDKIVADDNKTYGNDIVEIKNNYTVKWQDYKLTEISPNQKFKFQYLLLEIPPKGR